MSSDTYPFGVYHLPNRAPNGDPYLFSVGPSGHIVHPPERVPVDEWADAAARLWDDLREVVGA